MSFLYACIDMSLTPTPSQGQNSTKQEYQWNVDAYGMFWLQASLLNSTTVYQMSYVKKCNVLYTQFWGRPKLP